MSDLPNTGTVADTGWLVANPDICGLKKKGGNANGGREFDFRLADGGLRRLLASRPHLHTPQLSASGNKHSTA